MLTSRNTTTTILGVIIAAGLVIIGGGAATIAPSAFALPMGAHMNANVDGATLSNQVPKQNIPSPELTNNEQTNDSSLYKDIVKNSFGVGTANQNNHQMSIAGTSQDAVPQGNTTTTVSQTAPSLNTQEFKSTLSTIMFCMLTSGSSC